MKANINRSLTSSKCNALENWKETNRQHRKERMQDPFWYAKDQTTIDRMANLTWNNVVGDVLIDESEDVIPAILMIPYMRSAGNTDYSKNNTLTRTADTFFQYMAQGFTGNVDFEAPDLLMTSMAGSSVMADMMEAKRMFGFLNYFTDQNNYYAKKLIRALGFDYDSFTKGESSKSDFVSDFNIRVEQINKIIAIPKGLMVDERWNYLSSYVFSDNSDPEFNTLFAFTCRGSLRYNGTAMTTGTCLTWTNMFSRAGENGLTYSQFFGYIDEMINSLIGDDQRQMFAALRRVYSDDQFIKLSELTLDFTSDIVRNDVVAASVHNGTYFDMVEVSMPQKLSTSGDHIDAIIYQTENGTIETNPIGGMFYPDEVGTPRIEMLNPFQDRLLDMFGHDITPGNILDVTATMSAVLDSGRLVDWIGSDEEIDFNGITITRPAVLQTIVPRSEILLTPELWSNATDGLTFEMTRIYLRSAIDQFSEYHELVPKSFHALSHINSHPFVFSVRFDPEYTADWPDVAETYMTISKIYGEVDTYTGVSNGVLSRMHQRAIVELFKLPRSTRSVT